MRLASAVSGGLAAAACTVLSGCAATTADADAGETSRLTVFAAASLTDAFADLEAGFEAAHPGVDVTIVHGGSSSLAAQIVEGAPADLFASADEAQMAAVAGLIAGEPAVFATNTLTMVVPPGNPAGVTALSDLEDPSIVSVICAPQVPCGAATGELADGAGVALRPSSQEGSVTDVLGKVETGQADAGVVYVTDVRRAQGVEEVPIDRAQAVVNHYPIASLTDAADPELADAFVAYVTGTEGRHALAAHGFGAP